MKNINKLLSHFCKGWKLWHPHWFYGAAFAQLDFDWKFFTTSLCAEKMYKSCTSICSTAWHTNSKDQVCINIICNYIFTLPIQLDVTLPEGSFSHCATVWNGGIIIVGGLSSSLQPIGSCLYLSYKNNWHITTITFGRPLPPK